MLIIIIGVVLCGAAMFYCMSNKKIRIRGIIASVFWVGVLLIGDLSGPTKPEDYTPAARAELVRKYHVTPEALYQEQINRTPLEKAGIFMLITFLVVVMLYNAIAANLNKEEAKQLRFKYLSLFLALLLYMLSLYAGVQLMLVPYLKKKKAIEQSLETAVQ